jgi:hypothetical protein
MPQTSAKNSTSLSSACGRVRIDLTFLCLSSSNVQPLDRFISAGMMKGVFSDR